MANITLGAVYPVVNWNSYTDYPGNLLNLRERMDKYFNDVVNDIATRGLVLGDPEDIMRLRDAYITGAYNLINSEPSYSGEYNYNWYINNTTNGPAYLKFLDKFNTHLKERLAFQARTGISITEAVSVYTEIRDLWIEIYHEIHIYLGDVEQVKGSSKNADIMIKTYKIQAQLAAVFVTEGSMLSSLVGFELSQHPEVIMIADHMNAAKAVVVALLIHLRAAIKLINEGYIVNLGTTDGRIILDASDVTGMIDDYLLINPIAGAVSDEITDALKQAIEDAVTKAITESIVTEEILTGQAGYREDEWKDARASSLNIAVNRLRIFQIELEALLNLENNSLLKTSANTTIAKINAYNDTVTGVIRTDSAYQAEWSNIRVLIKQIEARLGEKIGGTNWGLLLGLAAAGAGAYMTLS